MYFKKYFQNMHWLCAFHKVLDTGLKILKINKNISFSNIYFQHSNIFPGFNRILAFSEAQITAVHVSVDGEPLGKGLSAGGPLYVLLWDPSLYLTGLHTIRVKVEVSTAFVCLPV